MSCVRPFVADVCILVLAYLLTAALRANVDTLLHVVGASLARAAAFVGESVVLANLVHSLTYLLDFVLTYVGVLQSVEVDDLLFAVESPVVL